MASAGEGGAACWGTGPAKGIGDALGSVGAPAGGGNAGDAAAGAAEGGAAGAAGVPIASRHPGNEKSNCCTADWPMAEIGVLASSALASSSEIMSVSCSVVPIQISNERSQLSMERDEAAGSIDCDTRGVLSTS